MLHLDIIWMMMIVGYGAFRIYNYYQDFNIKQKKSFTIHDYKQH